MNTDSARTSTFEMWGYKRVLKILWIDIEYTQNI